ncbi:MAG: aminotransferase class IV [Bacteroidota bacterium]|nr:aminotransferase class IV [Bacteroidota bacterium]
MDEIYILNGVKLDIPVIPINRGFLYADGFFESMLYRNGQIELWDLHTQRLTNNCKTLYMQAPDTDAIYNSVMQNISEVNSEKNIRIRLTIYRKGAGFYKPENNEAEWLLHLAEFIPAQTNICKLSIEKNLKKNITPFSNLKSLNAQLFVIITNNPEHTNADEILLLNENGHVCESTSSNIFWKKGDTYYTPSLETGCIGGVMRQHLINKFKEEGTPIIECNEPLQTILAADKVFVSNAVKGMREVEWI